MCIPVMTTSFIPFFDISFISSIIFSGLLLLTLPLAYGIMQYVQNLSHPSCTFMAALVFSVYVVVPNSLNSFGSNASFTSEILLLFSLNCSTYCTMSFFSLFPYTKSISSILFNTSFATCA